MAVSEILWGVLMMVICRYQGCAGFRGGVGAARGWVRESKTIFSFFATQFQRRTSLLWEIIYMLNLHRGLPTFVPRIHLERPTIRLCPCDLGGLPLPMHLGSGYEAHWGRKANGGSRL